MTRDLSVRRRAVRMSFFLAAAVLSCTNDPVSSGSPYLVVPVTTTPLTGTAGWALADTLVVEIRTSNGRPASGVRVHWSLPQGGSLAVQRAGVDDPMTGTTDDLGRSSAVWTLGLPEGTQEVRVAAGLGDPATAFTATATVLHAMQVTVGGGYACAVLPDQRPVCWGENRYGQLGTGDTLARAVPTPVQGLAAVRAIRASGGYTCALDLSGDVWCWGRNESGQVGPAGAQPLQLSPVRVAGADGAVSLSLSTADPFRGYTCAVLGAGGVSCWGNNSLGQLGTGDTISSATPRPVAGSGGFTNVYSGGILSCALDAAREAWCWGGARSGELAPLPKAVYTTPVRPVPGFTYTSLAVGAYAVCGIQVIGGTSCWGDDFGSFGHIPLSDLQPGDGPVHPDLSEPLAELASDGWNGYYARSTFGLGYVWGETGCCDVFTLPPQMITPSLRIEEISSGGPDYCVISESGGLYCGAVNWWFRGGRESLAGLPDRIGP